MNVTEREQRLDEVITAYLRAGEGGEPTDPAEWLARYPDLADELTDFFADHRHVERVAAPLRDLAPPAPPKPNAAPPLPASSSTPKLELPQAGRPPPDYEILGETAPAAWGSVTRARKSGPPRSAARRMTLP